MKTFVVAFVLSCVNAELHVSSRRYILADDPTTFITEADNKYEDQMLTLEPNSTAFVMIDVWSVPDQRLMENAELRMLPLLQLARSLGMLIIHAPSEALEWQRIQVLPGELMVTGTDGHPGSPSRCDGAILNSPRKIKHVLMAGYDTNKCIIDKPCGLVALSTELAAVARLVLVRDSTLGAYGWFGNEWYGQHATVNMLEMGWWMPPAQRGIPSVLLADLFVAAGARSNASALGNLTHPVSSATQVLRDDFPVPPAFPSGGGGVALVVVSCSSDYGNAGFQARVTENRGRYLEPILSAWRGAAQYPIIHALNGHKPAGLCVPRAGEQTPQNNDEFDVLLTKLDIHTLYYVGYAANTDMMFGVGGLQRFYSRSRYLVAVEPSYYWVVGAASFKPATPRLRTHVIG